MLGFCGILCLILLTNSCVQVSNSRSSTCLNDSFEVIESAQTITSIEEVDSEH
ncbi:MAG: hypothetical protein WCG10_06985 [Chlamydiota bacterium]